MFVPVPTCTGVGGAHVLLLDELASVLIIQVTHVVFPAASVAFTSIRCCPALS
jgi:hypothetical protein